MPILFPFVFALSFLITAATWVYIPQSGPSWVPTDESSLAFYFDFNDLDGAGDGPTGDGGLVQDDPISSVDDKSTYDVDFTSSGTARPTYEPSEVNGLACAKFNDASARQFMRRADQADGSDECTNGCTWFLVVKVANNTEEKYWMGKDYNISSNPERSWVVITSLTGFNDLAFSVFGDKDSLGSWHGRSTLNDLTVGTHILMGRFPSGASPAVSDIYISIDGTSNVSTTDQNTGSGFPSDNSIADVLIGSREDFSPFQWALDEDIICTGGFFNTRLDDTKYGQLHTFLDFYY